MWDMPAKRDPDSPLESVTLDADVADQTADADDPTKGGALPDPNDDTPRGRFNRGEITAAQLAAELDADADG